MPEREGPKKKLGYPVVGGLLHWLQRRIHERNPQNLPNPDPADVIKRPNPKFGQERFRIMVGTGQEISHSTPHNTTERYLLNDELLIYELVADAMKAVGLDVISIRKTHDQVDPDGNPLDNTKETKVIIQNTTPPLDTYHLDVFNEIYLGFISSYYAYKQYKDITGYNHNPASPERIREKVQEMRDQEVEKMFEHLQSDGSYYRIKHETRLCCCSGIKYSIREGDVDFHALVAKRIIQAGIADSITGIQVTPRSDRSSSEPEGGVDISLVSPDDLYYRGVFIFNKVMSLALQYKYVLESYGVDSPVAQTLTLSRYVDPKIQTLKMLKTTVGSTN